jgi:hypothetical protein
MLIVRLAELSLVGQLRVEPLLAELLLVELLLAELLRVELLLAELLLPWAVVNRPSYSSPSPQWIRSMR